MAFDSMSCEDLSYVRCDALGNVVELLVSGRALSGTLDFALFEQLPALRKLSIGGNRLQGAVLPSIFASQSLEEVSLRKNDFHGTIPCPSVTEPRLSELDLANNYFTGALPSCLFTMLPKLRDIDVSYNLLTDGTIFSDIQHAQQLVTFRANEAGLKGPLPFDLRCVRKLITFTARGNSLSGSVAQTVIDGLAMLNRLDLGFNQLEGVIPNFQNTPLKNLYLDHNKLSGDMTTQLLQYSLSQDRLVSSGIDISYNRISGPLPDVFYRMLTDAHGVGYIMSEGNNFRCDPATGEWPAWVWRVRSFQGGNPSRYSHSFGLCKPVPIVSSASDAMVGGLMPLTGAGFLPTDELRCRFTEPSWTYPVDVVALYRSPTAVDCILEAGKFAAHQVGVPLGVSVANYGDDFYSPTTQPAAFERVEATVLPLTAGISPVMTPMSPRRPPPAPAPPAPTRDVTCPAAPPPLPDEVPVGCEGVAVPAYTPTSCPYEAPCEVPSGSFDAR